MLGMVAWEDVWNVINFAKDKNDDWFLQGPARRFMETYNARPGFFTSYKNGYEFSGSLLANIVYPAALSVFSGFSVACVIFGAVLGVGASLAATGAALCGSYEFCDESIDNAATAFHIAGLGLTAFAISSLLLAFSLFHTPFSFLTRSGYTLFSMLTAPNSQGESTPESGSVQEVHAVIR
ncbi:hypothetical protein J2N86_10405 [Legionella lytica]|uniref:Uncharacterized protein n=1 Tax=Legionella lytica TaxID=96232 RepID=A0ABY4Y6N0_9GAMM|nr:hypothetical protein [Legionella lytica]USQ13101.1 hypothetical protein J2N86_10405 [Legionella lytica]